MAKPKQEHLVEVTLSGTIHIWTNDPRGVHGEIAESEGVLSAVMVSGNPIFVYVDPRYSKNDIAEEIRTLLASEVPSVFKG